jgi:hypothetical protein
MHLFQSLGAVRAAVAVVAAGVLIGEPIKVWLMGVDMSGV